MKKTMKLSLALAMTLLAGTALAADKVVLQLKWVTQAQFAGYYVAKDKGFYEAEGLDVEIKPGGPDIAPEQVIAGGGADVIVDWAGGALAAREKGVGLVNIAQPFKKAGMEMVCPKDGPIKTEADFKGHTLGVWFFGNEYPFFAWMNKLGLSTEGGPNGVTVLKQSFDVQPLVQKQADCISVMTYNEYWQAIDPKRFNTPIAERAFSTESVILSHPHLLADQEAMQAVVAACTKIHDRRDELADWAAAELIEAPITKSHHVGARL
jgi:NitT/TauT family transport system substrate-binding protein